MPITRVEDMREGDIVAFRHPRRGYHTGIYVGDGKFIHSPRRRLTVRITSLSDPYFNNTFLSARRINLNGNNDFVAEVQSRLNDYAEQKVTRELKPKAKGKANGNMNKAAKGGKTAAKKPVKAASGKENVRASAEKSKSGDPSDRARGKTVQKSSRGKTDKS
jgi:cell wall-associated NlpC family hydrolase